MRQSTLWMCFSSWTPQAVVSHDKFINRAPWLYTINFEFCNASGRWETHNYNCGIWVPITEWSARYRGTSENLMINFFDPRDDREDFKAMVHKLAFFFLIFEMDFKWWIGFSGKAGDGLETMCVFRLHMGWHCCWLGSWVGSCGRWTFLQEPLGPELISC